jgi:hypothetical protein
VEDGIAAQIRNIESEYGKPIGAWIELVNAGGLAKHAHIALLARAAEQPAPANAVQALDVLYAGKKAALRPVHDALIAAINAFGIGIEQIEKKGYISLRRAKQFAMIQPSTADRIDVSRILRDDEPRGPARARERIQRPVTHRVRVHTVTDIDELCSLASPRPTKGPAELVVPSVAPTLVVVAVAVAVAWFGLFGRRSRGRGSRDSDRWGCCGHSCEVGENFDSGGADLVELGVGDFSGRVRGCEVSVERRECSLST